MTTPGDSASGLAEALRALADEWDQELAERGVRRVGVLPAHTVSHAATEIERSAENVLASCSAQVRELLARTR